MEKDKKYIEAKNHLFHWTTNHSLTNFTSLLFVLIQKADISNKDKLKLSFPYEVQVLEDWNNSDPDTFFLDI